MVVTCRNVFKLWSFHQVMKTPYIMHCLCIDEGLLVCVWVVLWLSIWNVLCFSDLLLECIVPTCIVRTCCDSNACVIQLSGTLVLPGTCLVWGSCFRNNVSLLNQHWWNSSIWAKQQNFIILPPSSLPPSPLPSSSPSPLPLAPKAPRKTRSELARFVDADYYGYRDEEDGIIVPLEQGEEKKGNPTL